jgi:single-strand DNA-binding protein
MLIGYLGEDVKMHYFDVEICIGRFDWLQTKSISTKLLMKKSSEWSVVRNKAAEMCEKYLTKGDKIYVEGRIKSRQWQTEDGTVKHTTEIQVKRVFID